LRSWADKFVHVLGALPLQSGSPGAIGWFGASVFSIALCDARWTLFEGLFVVLSICWHVNVDQAELKAGINPCLRHNNMQHTLAA
jgi:hypothetical protein